MIGQTIAHYRITAPLGAGGMGEVYRAADSKLGRDVAIKLLPADVEQSPERLARFRREAQVLASLNHPNIAAIYGLEEADSHRALILELVEGPTLFDRLAAGLIPTEEAVELAHQMAEALEYAHDRGVVHRDLKPANVKVSPDDRVKVLDFGLAKALADPSTEASASGSDAPARPDSPTLTSPTLTSPITGALTGANVILGTAAYMSPEQARGKPVDRRSDIWSFGVVLWEMLTGERLFLGETVSDTVAAILKTEPDLSRVPDDAPPRLRELLERCLTKDPRRRLRDMGDVRLELEWIREGRGAAGSDSTTAERGTAARPSLPALVAALVLGAVLGIAAWNLATPLSPADSASSDHLTLVAPEGVEARWFYPSPDGRYVVIASPPRGEKDSRPGLHVRPLNSYSTHLIPGTQRALFLAFSPDSRWLAFVAPKDMQTSAPVLWKVPIDGGAPPLELRPWNLEWTGLHWLEDDTFITASASEGILRLPADGGAVISRTPLVAPEGVAIEDTVHPLASAASILPGGKHFLGTVEFWGDDGYRNDIVSVDLETGDVKRLLEDASVPRWLSSGHLLVSRGSTLLAVPFDLDRLEVTGGPTALVDDLRIWRSWNDGEFDLAQDGTLVYVGGGFVGGERRLVWLDRHLRELEPWSDRLLDVDFAPMLSADGRRVMAVRAGPDGVFDTYVSEPDRPVLQKWIERPGEDCTPNAWSTDGSRVAYRARTSRGSYHYVRTIADGTDRLVLEDTETTVSYSVSAFADDDASLLVTRFGDGPMDILRVDLTHESEGLPPVEMLLENAAVPEISPDGRWMAYLSESSGRWEAYVRRWQGGGRLGPERRISSDGVRGPSVFRNAGLCWYRPGDGGPLEIWFRAGSDVHSVRVAGETNLSPPRRVATWEPAFASMSPAPDGRILMLKYGPREAAFREVSVVRGWAKDVARKLAAGR